MIARQICFLALCFGACAHERVRPLPAAATHPLLPIAATRGAAYVISSAPRTGSLYRSGSRLKIRWVEPVGDSTVALPIAIYDSKLKMDCTLSEGDDTSCVPVGKELDEEKLAFLAPDQKIPALVVPDSECEAPQTTADDGHLWELGPMFGSFDDPKHLARYVLGPPQMAKDAWTAEGPDCVVTFENVRAPLCARPFRIADTTDVVHAKEIVIGKSGSGAVVVQGSDGSVLPRAFEPAAFDGANGFKCSVGAESDKCLPPPWDHLGEPPVIGTTVNVDNYIGHPTPWGMWEKDETKVFAKLSPADPNSGNRQARQILAVLNDDNVMNLELQIEGKNRLGVHVRTTPGGQDIPFSFYDTSLKRDCEATQTDDGTWRCMVKLASSCMTSEVLGADGAKHEVLTGSTSFCKKDGTCCAGGAVWFPSEPARGPRRFGMDARSTSPAVPERAVLFSETGQVADHIQGWQTQIRKAAYEKVRDLTPDTFAPLRLVQDP